MLTNLARYAGLLLLVQSAAACSGEQSTAPAEDRGAAANVAAPAPVADAKLVVAFGDSLYAGYQLGPNEGFAPQLQQALQARGVAAEVRNAGVSGDTTAAGAQRLAFTLDGLPRKPDLVILGLGGNDALRGLSPDETRRNLTAILTELRRREIPLVLTGMMAPRNMGPDYAAAFDPIYPALAREFGAALYPFFLDGVIGNPDLLLDDGMHPNAQGVAAVSAGIAPLVSEQLERD